jgi:hypothetical protein
MNRVWRPLDVNGLRLYRVELWFPGHREWDLQKIVAARSPTDAAEIVARFYSGMEWRVEPTIKGFSLEVCQPEEWCEIEHLAAKPGSQRATASA